jgi:hypothetical protein
MAKKTSKKDLIQVDGKWLMQTPEGQVPCPTLEEAITS